MRKGELQKDGFLGACIFNDGEEYIQQAWEAPTSAKRQTLARKGLKQDLDLIDGYIILGETAKTLAEQLALFREAVRVGDRLWGPVLDDPEIEWWLEIGTRPYLRAMHHLGIALEDAGDLAEAEDIYQRMLKLNPNDNQGVRCLLVRVLMHQDRIEDLQALLKSYPDDYMLEMMMADLWLKLREKDADMSKLGPKIHKRNEFVLPILAGQGPKKIEYSIYGVTVGGADEAESYVDEFDDIWRKDKTIMSKIKDYVSTLKI